MSSCLFLVFLRPIFSLLVPCARLSWPYRELLNARKYMYTVSHRVVSYNSRDLQPNEWMEMSNGALWDTADTLWAISWPQYIKLKRFRPHRSNSWMRPIATGGVAWSVRVCVCVPVCWSRLWALQQTTELIEMPLGGWLLLAEGTITRCGSRSPRWRDNFWGLSGQLKSVVSHCCIVRCKKSITASQRHCYSRLQCYRLVGVTLHRPREKSALCDAAFRLNSLAMLLIFTVKLSLWRSFPEDIGTDEVLLNPNHCRATLC